MKSNMCGLALLALPCLIEIVLAYAFGQTKISRDPTIPTFVELNSTSFASKTG